MTDMTAVPRILSAAQAAQDADLWQRVERGEARVTDKWNDTLIGVTSEVEGYSVRLISGKYAYQAGEVVSHGSYNWDELLTITAIPIADQSPSSPAAIERAEADADVLREVINELRSTNERLAGTVENLREFMRRVGYGDVADLIDANTPFGVEGLDAWPPEAVAVPSGSPASEAQTVEAPAPHGDTELRANESMLDGIGSDPYADFIRQVDRELGGQLDADGSERDVR